MTFHLRPAHLLALVTVLGLIAVPLAQARAETAAEKGLRIAKASTERNRGYGDLIVDGEMLLLNRAGASSKRRFEVRWVENSGNRGARSLLVFDWPGDIRNTALLTHTYYSERDDQWLWLPDLNKVRRISGSGRSGSFVGSEFAYEDMSDQEHEKFDHVWIRDEACPTGAGGCHVVDRRPKEKSGYSLQRVWFDTGQLRVQQVQYFDRRGAHLKTLRSTGYRLYQGQFWRPSRMDMRNHLTGKATTLTWSNYRFNTGISGNAFTPNALKRIR